MSEKILSEAKERYSYTHDWESYARNNFKFDKRFDAQDSINNYGWPDELYRPRIESSKPCLTFNKVHQHVLHVTNDAAQNKPSVTIRPVGNGATFKAAEIIEGIVRHIEMQSDAGDAYDIATKNQVVGGIGWWRLTTEWADSDSFHQDIFIKQVPDPLSIMMDPDIKTQSGEDARFAFVFADMPKSQFDKQYPKFKNSVAGMSALGEDQDDTRWMVNRRNNKVRVCEYFRRVEKKDTLHSLIDGSTARASAYKDAGMADMLKSVEDGGRSVQTRVVSDYEVEWYLIAGDMIIDQNIWPGSTIPLVRVIGEERITDGVMDRVGIVRAMLDSQRMYNVMGSSAVETVGVQTKVPWLVSAEAVEGYETMWAAANQKNYPYLVWNSYDDVGNREIPKPERTEPPQYPPAYAQGLQQAAADMQGVSGQYDSQMGAESNERSGRAINERVRNGNMATYHFINNLAVGIRHTGRIILELIPKLYDTQRVLKILGEDGQASTVAINPDMPMAHAEAPDVYSFTNQQVSAVLNPSVGKYECIADVGPNYGTRRQEAFEALTQILSQNESLAPIVGDLLFKSADFPLADEIAARLANMVPPQALGQGVPPAVQQLQQQLAQQHQIMVQMEQELQAAKSKQQSTDMQKDIDTYEAETRRLAAVGKIDPAALMPVLREMVSQILQTPVNPVINQHLIEQAQMERNVQMINPQQQNQQGGMPS